MKRGKRYLGILLSLVFALSVVTPAFAAEAPVGSTTVTEAEITADDQSVRADETMGTEENSPSAGDDTESGETTLNGTASGDAGISDADDQGIAGTEVVGGESADEAGSTDNPEFEEESDDLIPLAADDADVVHVTSVTLDTTKLTLETKDQNVQLTATVEPEDAADQGVTWSSSKESVVKVDDNGKLTAVKNGTATITVKTNDGGYTAECVVTVSLYSNGFHQEPGGTDWCYYKDGKIATGTTDLIRGTVNGTKGYWNVVKGRVVASATVAKGTVDGTNAWWYVNKKGMVDKSYTGFAKNSSGTWYAESGRVTKKTNGVFKDSSGAIGSKNNWYYVLNSKVQTDFTGLADYSNASGWWYITNGKVDRSVTTVAKNKNGWYYVKNGKVDRSYTGFAKNSNGSWYVEKGKVSKKVNGVLKDTKGALGSSSAWYYVLNSKVQTGFTGLANYSNASGWWYITNGKVDRSYTGLAKNKNGWWYVSNGKVDRSYTGTAKNSNGWWYVKKGKVDKSAVALVKVDGEWKAYKNGKYAGNYTGMAINENGWWYVDNGTLIRDECLTDAARYVGAHTSTSQSSGEKLRTIYDYMRSHYNYIRSYDGKPGTEDMASYAVDFFKDQGGNCYRYAIGATCIVKVLGYDTRTVLGNVSTSDGSGMTRHGWCELYVNGGWYILDVNFGVYIKKADQHPRKLEVENRYVLSVENGKAVWQ